MKDTFYGGKNGIDIVCLDDQMKVVASGTRASMMELAEAKNYAVAEMKPIRFVTNSLKYFKDEY